MIAPPPTTSRRGESSPAWMGRPALLAAAIGVWRVPLAAAYCLFLLVDGARALIHGGTPAEFQGELALALVSAVAIGLLLLLSAMTARTSAYEIGEDGVVMTFGLGLRARVVIPFAAIERVGVRVHASGRGDVAVRLRRSGVAYLKLWPHVRPGTVFRPEPMLRGLVDAGVAGSLIARRTSEAVEARAAAERRGQAPSAPAERSADPRAPAAAERDRALVAG